MTNRLRVSGFEARPIAVSEHNNTMPRLYRGLAVLILPLCWITAHASEPLSTIIDINREGNQAEAEAQRQIDALSDTRRALFEEYDALGRELVSLSADNAQLQRMVDDQDDQRQAREQTLEKLTDTRREILPLLLAMVDWLEELARADLPVRVEERRHALVELQDSLDRGDLDLGARYERVLEHYAQAVADGQRVEVHSGALPGATAQVVDFLKVGRLALYYQSPDGQHSSYWDAARQQWVPLPEEENRELARALRVVRKEAPPDLLRLPLQAPSVIEQETSR